MLKIIILCLVFGINLGVRFFAGLFRFVIVSKLCFVLLLSVGIEILLNNSTIKRCTTFFEFRELIILYSSLLETPGSRYVMF